MSTASNVVRHEVHADFVAYCHAFFNSPADSAMYDALTKGYLGNFPRLTARMCYKDKPNAIATAKGHLRQQHQKSKKSGVKVKKPSSPSPSTLPPTCDAGEVADELLYSDYISTKVIHTTQLLNSSDMPGRFPYVSYLGHEYVLISVFRGYIHAELMRDRNSAELVKAYRATYKFYTDLGHSPKFQMLDNESSKDLSKFFKEEAKVEAQFVPPSTHRRNRAERAIQDWKGHYIAGLATVDPDFRMSLWCALVPQSELTLNHLCPYTPQPHLSAYEGLFGKKFDFVAHPIHPLGTKIVILDPVSNRESWAPHGLDGFYIGPALDHYKCYRVFVSCTNDFRISDSISWHPKKLHLPGSTKEELIYEKAEEILAQLQIIPTSSSDPSLLQLSSDMHSLLRIFSLTHTSQEQRVEKVPIVLVSPTPAATPLLPPISNSPSPTGIEIHPTDSRARARRQETRDRNTAADVYYFLAKKDCPRDYLIFFDYLGKEFTDTDDDLHFQLTNIVVPAAQPKKGAALTPFFRYYDTDKFVSSPLLESDFEHTPCAEFIKFRRSTKSVFFRNLLNGIFLWLPALI